MSAPSRVPPLAIKVETAALMTATSWTSLRSWVAFDVPVMRLIAAVVRIPMTATAMRTSVRENANRFKEQVRAMLSIINNIRISTK